MNAKTARIILILVLVLGISGSVVNAATATASMNADKTTVKQGETFTVKMGASSAEGLNALVATIEYDETKLELTEAKVVDTSKWSNMGSGKQINIICNSQDEIKEDENIYQMTFKAKEGVATGKTTIKAKEMYVDTNVASNSKVTIEDKAVEITIEEKSNGGTGDNLATLTGIKIRKAPNKTEYNAGEEFDKTGMIIVAEYSDETEKEITSYTCEPTGELTTAIKAITIKYTENGTTKTATQSITVKGVAVDKDGGSAGTNKETKDNTTAANKISQTGIEDYAIPTLGLAGVITVISIVLYNKYKIF